MQVSWNKCLNKFQILKYEKIDVSQGIDANKTIGAQVYYLPLLVLPRDKF